MDATTAVGRCASDCEAPDLDGAQAISEEEPGGRYVALGKRLVAWMGYAKSDVQVHRPGGFTSQLLRTSGLRVPLLVKGDASGLIPTLGICLPEDFDIEHRATDTLEDDDRTVLTWDVARQEYGPAWSVAQWALYWRVRKGFAGKPAAADAAVGPPPGAGTGDSDDSDGGEEVDSKFVKRGGLEQYRKRAEGRRVGIADAQFTRLLEAHWLDLARGPLAGHLHPPLAVAEADLVRLAWRHQAGARRREGGVGVSEMLHLEMSPRGCYTDFTLAPGGAAVHTHVLRGRRAFALLPPTPHNRSLFLTWMRQARGPGCFLAEYAENAQKVEVGEGQMLVIPHGWMYAATSLADCISVAGLFWHPYALGEIVKAQQLEAAVAASFPAAAAARRGGGAEAAYAISASARALLWHAAHHYAGVVRRAAGLPVPRPPPLARPGGSQQRDVSEGSAAVRGSPRFPSAGARSMRSGGDAGWHGSVPPATPPAGAAAAQAAAAALEAAAAAAGAAGDGGALYLGPPALALGAAAATAAAAAQMHGRRPSDAGAAASRPGSAAGFHHGSGGLPPGWGSAGAAAGAAGYAGAAAAGAAAADAGGGGSEATHGSQGASARTPRAEAAAPRRQRQHLHAHAHGGLGLHDAGDNDLDDPMQTSPVTHAMRDPSPPPAVDATAPFEPGPRAAAGSRPWAPPRVRLPARPRASQHDQSGPAPGARPDVVMHHAGEEAYGEGIGWSPTVRPAAAPADPPAIDLAPAAVAAARGSYGAGAAGDGTRTPRAGRLQLKGTSAGGSSAATREQQQQHESRKRGGPDSEPLETAPAGGAQPAAQAGIAPAAKKLRVRLPAHVPPSPIHPGTGGATGTPSWGQAAAAAATGSNSGNPVAAAAGTQGGSETAAGPIGPAAQQAPASIPQVDGAVDDGCAFLRATGAGQWAPSAGLLLRPLGAPRPWLLSRGACVAAVGGAIPQLDGAADGVDHTQQPQQQQPVEGEREQQETQQQQQQQPEGQGLEGVPPEQGADVSAAPQQQQQQQPGSPQRPPSQPHETAAALLGTPVPAPGLAASAAVTPLPPAPAAAAPGATPPATMLPGHGPPSRTGSGLKRTQPEAPNPSPASAARPPKAGRPGSAATQPAAAGSAAPAAAGGTPTARGARKPAGGKHAPVAPDLDNLRQGTTMPEMTPLGRRVSSAADSREPLSERMARMARIREKLKVQGIEPPPRRRSASPEPGSAAAAAAAAGGAGGRDAQQGPVVAAQEPAAPPPQEQQQQQQAEQQRPMQQAQEQQQQGAEQGNGALAVQPVGECEDRKTQTAAVPAAAQLLPAPQQQPPQLQQQQLGSAAAEQSAQSPDAAPAPPPQTPLSPPGSRAASAPAAPVAALLAAPLPPAAATPPPAVLAAPAPGAMLPPAPAKLSDWELRDLPLLAAYLRDRLRRHDDAEVPWSGPGAIAAPDLLLDQLEEGLRALSGSGSSAVAVGGGAGAAVGSVGAVRPQSPRSTGAARGGVGTAGTSAGAAGSPPGSGALPDAAAAAAALRALLPPLEPLPAAALPPGFEAHVRAYVAPGELVEACATEGQGETEGRSASTLTGLESDLGAAGAAGPFVAGSKRSSLVGDEQQRAAVAQQKRRQQAAKEQQKKANNIRSKILGTKR